MYPVLVQAWALVLVCKLALAQWLPASELVQVLAQVLVQVRAQVPAVVVRSW